MLVSQPSAAIPSQSLNPVVQLAIAQASPVHLGVAFASMQALVHEPQCCGSVSMSTSQPSAATPLQSL
jgi:hypothetical protein